jgi:peptidoglycan hydrolase-like protein with peptidoglycan-binding domain
LLAPIKQGERGWRAFVVQKVVGVVADGVWGPGTEQSVRAWQLRHKLTADGVMGPKSQTLALEKAGERADRKIGMPKGLGYGFAVTEGANLLAATNWQVPGGVDCGPAQWRILGPPYDYARLKYAFTPRAALEGALERLRAAQTDYMKRNRHLAANPQEALAVAALQHNWPAGADSIVRKYPGDGRWWRYVTSPDAVATWVTGHTRASWAREYPARVLRFVA